MSTKIKTGGELSHVPQAPTLLGLSNPSPAPPLTGSPRGLEPRKKHPHTHTQSHPLTECPAVGGCTGLGPWSCHPACLSTPPPPADWPWLVLPSPLPCPAPCPAWSLFCITVFGDPTSCGLFFAHLAHWCSAHYCVNKHSKALTDQITRSWRTPDLFLQTRKPPPG